MLFRFSKYRHPEGFPKSLFSLLPHRGGPPRPVVRDAVVARFVADIRCDGPRAPRRRRVPAPLLRILCRGVCRMMAPQRPLSHTDL